EAELVRSLRGQRPAIMILTGSRFADSTVHDSLVEELTAYQSTGGRVVFLGQGSLPFPSVVLENRAGAFALAQALVAQGYRRFGVLGGQPSLLTAVDRVAGFVAGAKDAGVAVNPDHIVYGDFTREGGYTAMDTLITHHLDAIDLVFAANDVMAVGALSALREHNVDVPGDIALAGYDDIQTARDVYPPLTTVHVALDQVGELAVGLALEGSAAATLSVDSSVVLRASTPRRGA
ncbi:MAG: substrate-binding domain-containing protein, partial [Demequina sp.]